MEGQGFVLFIQHSKTSTEGNKVALGVELTMARKIINKSTNPNPQHKQDILLHTGLCRRERFRTQRVL